MGYLGLRRKGRAAVLLIGFTLLSLSSGLYSQNTKIEDIAKIHTKLYKRVSPAVVGITYGTNFRGTGTIIDSSGLILTSTTATGIGNNEMYVYRQGHKRSKATVVKLVKEKDLVLLKIEDKELPTVELGDSDRVKIGQVAYVLGDSFNSIFTDDQVALSVGIISGSYTLKEPKVRDSAYKGPVLETSAAVNPNQSGAPLLDAEGKLIGVISLNYEESKFTGLAIPINELKSIIEEVKTGAPKKERRKF